MARGNRVEAATPPSIPRPARVRREAENTFHGPCHKKNCRILLDAAAFLEPLFIGIRIR